MGASHKGLAATRGSLHAVCKIRSTTTAGKEKPGRLAPSGSIRIRGGRRGRGAQPPPPVPIPARSIRARHDRRGGVATPRIRRLDTQPPAPHAVSRIRNALREWCSCRSLWQIIDGSKLSSPIFPPHRGP